MLTRLIQATRVQKQLEDALTRAKTAEDLLGKYEGEVEFLEGQHGELLQELEKTKEGSELQIAQLRSTSNELEREQMEIISQLRDEISTITIRNKERLQQLEATQAAKLEARASEIDALRCVEVLGLAWLTWCPGDSWMLQNDALKT